MNVGKTTLWPYLGYVESLIRRYIYTGEKRTAERILLRLESAVCIGCQLGVFRNCPSGITSELPPVYCFHGTWDLKGFLDKWRDWWQNPHAHLQEDIPAVVQLRDETREKQVNTAVRTEVERNLSDKARKTLGLCMEHEK